MKFLGSCLLSAPTQGLRGWALSAICLAVTVAGFSGCSTDVEVNAPYQDRAVVYALLNVQDKEHYIRIQKSFLTIEEPDALKAAKVKDSVYYTGQGEPIVGVLYREDQATPAGPVLSTRLGTLERLDITGKDTGVFYSPDQYVYRFRGSLIPELDTNNMRDSTQLRNLLLRNPGVLARRRIRLEISNNKGYKAIARTKLVYPLFDDRDINQTTDGYTMVLPAVSGDFRSFTGTNPRVRVKRHLNGYIFKFLVYVPYEEVMEDSSRQTLTKTWTFLFDTRIDNSSQQLVAQEYQLNQPVFFDFLRENVDTLKPGVAYRRFLPLRVRVLAGDSSLSVYSAISGQFSAITQTKPFFTNVQGGIGLLGSRTEKTFYARPDITTYNTLRARRYQALKFRP